MAKLAADGAEPGLSEAGPALPDLGDLAYRAQRYLLTDSIMSEILVVRDEAGSERILKIAAVRQRSRAQVNRQAIYNSVTWMEKVGRHPGIVTLHPIERRGKTPPPATAPTYVTTLTNVPGNPELMVLDYLQGGTLSDFVRKRALPLKVTLWLAHQLATTLAHLHEHGCVHRDLKPENILFAVPPRETHTLQALQPLLIDFGVAAKQGDEKFVCGSRLWMAPELQEAYEQKLLPVDSSLDLYALGLICCYMISGLRPRRKAYDYQSYLDYQQEAFARSEAAVNEESSLTTEARATQLALLQRFQRLLTQTLLPRATDRPSAAAFAMETAALVTALGTSVGAAQSVGKPNKKAHQPFVPATPKPDAVAGVTRDHKEVQVQQEKRGERVESVANPSPVLRQPAWRNPFSIRILLGAILLLVLLALIPILLGGQSASRDEGFTNASETVTAAVVVDEPTVEASEAAALVAVATATALETIARQTTATQADQPSPPPTLAPLTLVANAGSASTKLITGPAPAAPIPTLALTVQTEVDRDPPTLAVDPPTPTLRPTPSPFPTPSPLPTRTATRQPTAVPTQTATAVAPPQLRLLSPAADSASAAERITFAWESVGATPTADQCYELVFWDPQNSADKRSPVGAGQESQRTVNLRALADGTEPLLRRWVRLPDGFAWGVRVVACAAPRSILQDVREERHYRYQP